MGEMWQVVFVRDLSCSWNPGSVTVGLHGWGLSVGGRRGNTDLGHLFSRFRLLTESSCELKYIYSRAPAPRCAEKKAGPVWF